MIKIWHTATHSTNIGDAALICGIHSTIREDWGEAVEFIPDHLMRYDTYWGSKKFDIDLVEQINSKSDLLLIGGGGMIDGGRGNKGTGMAFNLPFPLWGEIRVPIAFYALGQNLFPNQRYWHSIKLLQLINYAASKENILFSVRNDGPLERLKAMFSTPIAGVEEIPDPGLYVPTQNVDQAVLCPEKINIVIQLAGDNPFNRFGCSYWKYVAVWGKRVLRDQMRQYFKKVGKALQEVAKDYPVNYILCPHLVRDFFVLSEFVACIPTGFSRFNFNVSNVLRGVNQAPVFFDLYRKADIVIGMRGHSVICGIGVGTPTIGLSSHDKIKGFMDSVGFHDRMLEIKDPGLESKLAKTIATVIQNREGEKQRILKAYNQCREKTAQFNKKIFNLLN